MKINRIIEVVDEKIKLINSLIQMHKAMRTFEDENKVLKLEGRLEELCWFKNKLNEHKKE